MEFEQSLVLAASRPAVWHALMDPGVLQKCIPGCDALELESDGGYRARVSIRLGPLAASFNSRIVISNVRSEESYTLEFSGSAGLLGAGRGVARVDLTDGARGQTILRYQANAHVSGKLAQVGARLIDSTVRTLAGRFFDAFSTQVGCAPATR